jgi:hypothetical protein
MIMHVDVESLTGPLSGARRALGRAIAVESFSAFRDRIDSVRFEVPSIEERGPTRTCRVRVRLKGGRTLVCAGTADSVADALERAAHDMRRIVAAELGVPLTERRTEIADSRFDRRAS